jgi:ABC-type glycerol-3-phosphate transport system permease component
VLIVMAVIVLYPVLWMTYSSFKPNAAIFANVFSFPDHFYFHNFVTIFSVGHLGLFFRNSAFISSVSTVGVVSLCAMAAYGLTLLSDRPRRWLLMFFLIGLMVPPQALIAAAYRWIGVLGLIDTFWALILMYMASVSFGILIMYDFLSSVPKDIVDAARMDGAGHMRVFLHVMLPLSRPSLATVGLLSFVGIWNDFLYPLVFLQSPSKFTVPIGVLSLSNVFNIQWGDQMAALTIATVVPVGVYLILQKQFVRALTAGSVKG